MSNENSAISLALPSTVENSDSLVEKEFLVFVDELSQETSPLLEKEGKCQSDTAPSNHLKETSHSLVQESKLQHLLLRMKVLKLNISLLIVYQMKKVMQLSLPTFLLLKVNLVQPCLI